MKPGRIVGRVVVTGRSARLGAVTREPRVDAVIMGIVDCFDVEGRSVSLA